MGRNLRFAFGVSSCQSRVKLLCYCCFLDFLCLSDTLAPPEALVLMFGFHFRVLAINDTGEGGSTLGVKRYIVSRLRSWADLVILGFLICAFVVRLQTKGRLLTSLLCPWAGQGSPGRNCAMVTSFQTILEGPHGSFHTRNAVNDSKSSTKKQKELCFGEG